MKFRHCSKILSILLVIIVCGCVSQRKEPPWVDLSEIHDQLIQDKKQQAVIDEVKQGDVNRAPQGPTVKNMSAGQDLTNPALQSFAKKKTAERGGASAEGEGVLLNFDNADIYEVIQVIAEILNLDYIVDPQVKGVVNIRSGKKIPMNGLYEIFKKILNINGLDIVKEGKYHYIYPSKNPSINMIYSPNQIGQLKDSPRIVMQVVPVMHIAAATAVKLIKPFLSEKGNVFDLANMNTIFVVDYESKVMEVLSILAKLDVSPLSSLKIRLVRINNAPLFDLQTELGEVLKSMQINNKGNEGVTVLPLERVNSLLLVSKNDQILNNALRWIKELDVVPSEGRDNIYIYNVRNTVATELGQLVSELIQGGNSVPRTKSASTNKNSKNSGNKKDSTQGRAVKKGPASGRKAAAKKGNQSGMRFAGEPSLISDDSRNIIIIRALPGDYIRIVKLLERLDNMPRQVMIEVLVAEVQLSDSWSMGVEWALKESGRLKIGHSDGSVSAYNNSYTSSNALDIAANGFTYGVTNTVGDIVGIINTIASENEVSILSSPQIMVLNNETATVNVGDQVPIVTSENLNSVTTGGTDTRTIEYRDTGVILTVTPKINHDGIIILDIDQQVSSASVDDTLGISSPVISSRSLKTKVAVRDGQTIFMGGLIETRKTNTQGGIPFLMKIPILGWLFKNESDSTAKTELLVMITPYVIDSESVMDQYIESFQVKMKALRKNLNPQHKKRRKKKREDKPKDETTTD